MGLETLRAALEDERSRLVDELAEGVDAPGTMTYGSQAAAASQVFEQQRSLALRDRARAHLEQVEAALRRMDDGSFGRCTNCGRDIDPERLEARPWAALCIDCQRAEGRSSRVRSSPP